MTPRSLPRTLAGLLVVAALVVSCADDESSTPTTTTPLPTTTPSPTTTGAATSTTGASTTSAAPTTTARPVTTTTPPTTTTTACSTAGFARTTDGDDTIPAGAALLTAVRIGRHDCYERIVFEFAAPHMPEYRVFVSEPPFSGPSGEPVPVRGSSYLTVRFATANAHTEEGEATIGIAPILPSGYVSLRQIQLIEDFEAMVIFAIGLDAPRPFRVLQFMNPPRVAVDIATG